MRPHDTRWTQNGKYYIALNGTHFVRFPITTPFHGDRKTCNHSLLALACYVASNFSHDPSTKVGSVLVPQNALYHDEDGKQVSSSIVFGANQIPWEMDEYARVPNVRTEVLQKDRNYKLAVCEHAERSCIYSAAYNGIVTRNSVMYATWFSCIDCTRAIISSGVGTIYGLQFCSERQPERWKENIELAMKMFNTSPVVKQFISTDEFLSKQKLEYVKFATPRSLSEINRVFSNSDAISAIEWKKYVPSVQIDGTIYLVQ